ncbi:M91 family zinc metallopeptidase [Corallococcus sp. RDP092CA]|uniref:M91 family zinc metallopeptidase n=1 Tax=Corallococcus sp. RDP092CA TaxID=3109369 RepID=UPI0035B22765
MTSKLKLPSLKMPTAGASQAPSTSRSPAKAQPDDWFMKKPLGEPKPVSQPPEEKKLTDGIRRDLLSPGLPVRTEEVALQDNRKVRITTVGQLKIGETDKQPGFTLAALRDLKKISSTETGRMELNGINRHSGLNGTTEKHVQIWKKDESGTTDKAGESKAFGIKEGAKVEYSPQDGIPDPKHASHKEKYGAWGTPQNKPSDSTLLHELHHAREYVDGTIDTKTTVKRGNKQDLSLSEMSAAGLDGFKDSAFIEGKGKLSRPSENTYRHEQGLPQRTFYADKAEVKNSGVDRLLKGSVNLDPKLSKEDAAKLEAYKQKTSLDE